MHEIDRRLETFEQDRMHAISWDDIKARRPQRNLMTFSVFFTLAADAEMTEAAKWYAAVGLGLAERFEAEIDRTIERIGNDPAMYALTHKNVRRAVLNDFPYALIYRIEIDAVFVIACIHTSRDPRIWQAAYLRRNDEDQVVLDGQGVGEPRRFKLGA